MCIPTKCCTQKRAESHTKPINPVEKQAHTRVYMLPLYIQPNSRCVSPHRDTHKRAHTVRHSAHSSNLPLTERDSCTAVSTGSVTHHTLFPISKFESTEKPVSRMLGCFVLSTRPHRVGHTPQHLEYTAAHQAQRQPATYYEAAQFIACPTKRSHPQPADHTPLPSHLRERQAHSRLARAVSTPSGSLHQATRFHKASSKRFGAYATPVHTSTNS